MSNTIECPHCHKLVNVEEALSHKLELEYNKKLSAQRKMDESRFNAEVQKQLEELSKQFEEKAALKYQSQLKLKEEEKLRLQAHIQEEKGKITEQFESKLKIMAAEKVQLNAQIKQAENLAKEQAWTTFQQEKKTLLGLLESEKSLRESAIQKAAQERQEFEELLRKTQQEAQSRYLSQREQGESFEQSATALIKEHFPDDQIEEIKVGKNGTDLLLHIMNDGKLAGNISIECKNPANKNSWTTWAKKTRLDMVNEGSKLALIVSTIPFDNGIITDNGQIFGVHSSEAIGVITLLRKAIIEIYRAEQSAKSSDSKAKALADFFRSSKWDNMLLEATKSLVEISGKVKSIKNAADHIQKNSDLVMETFVLSLRTTVEKTFLMESMKVA